MNERLVEALAWGRRWLAAIVPAAAPPIEEPEPDEPPTRTIRPDPPRISREAQWTRIVGYVDDAIRRAGRVSSLQDQAVVQLDAAAYALEDLIATLPAHLRPHQTTLTAAAAPRGTKTGAPRLPRAA